MTSPDLTPPAPPPPSPRPRARERWSVALLLGLAAIGVVLLWLSDVFRGPSEGRGEDQPTALDDDPATRLRATERRRKPIPADTVEAVVVTKDRQEPLEGIEVRLRSALGSDDVDDGARARTDVDGRARLSGDLPGFLEVVSDAWIAAPAVVAAEGGREARFELVPRAPFRATLLDAATGLPLSDWRLSPAGLPSGAEAPRTDGQGTAAWPGLVRPPTLVAVSDGRRRVQSFLLYPLASRSEIRLAMPPVARTTRLRVLDGDRHPIPGARVHVLGEETGVAIDLDDRGEGDLDYGARDGVSVTVTAPGRVRRSVRLDGQPELVVGLEAEATRAFRVRRTDGTDAPDGTRLRGSTHGPLSYGAQGPGIDFAGATDGGVARVAGLPAGRFEGLVEASGPGLDAILRFSAGDDPSVATELTAGPPRRFTLRVLRSASEGAPAEPFGGIVLVHGPVAGGCAAPAESARRAIDDAVALGRSDEFFATLVARAGPEIALTLPSCAEPRGVQVAAPGGEYACVEVAAAATEGTLEARLLPALPRAEPPPTAMLVEWDDGAPAALVELEIRRDESGAPAARVVTDSSGTALLRETTGRFTVATTRSDGARFAGDGPLLLPAPGVPLVRLKAVGR